MNGKTLIILTILLAGWGYWMLKPGEPVDISEAKARKIAQDSFEDFASMENMRAWEFEYKESTETSPDPRFHWVYHYVNDKSEPRLKISVHVGRRAEKSVELNMLPSLEAEAAAVAVETVP